MRSTLRGVRGRTLNKRPIYEYSRLASRLAEHEAPVLTYSDRRTQPCRQLEDRAVGLPDHGCRDTKGGQVAGHNRDRSVLVVNDEHGHCAGGCGPRHLHDAGLSVGVRVHKLVNHKRTLHTASHVCRACCTLYGQVYIALAIALKQFRALAADKDANAQFILGCCYEGDQAAASLWTEALHCYHPSFRARPSSAGKLGPTRESSAKLGSTRESSGKLGSTRESWSRFIITFSM